MGESRVGRLTEVFDSGVFEPREGVLSGVFEPREGVLSTDDEDILKKTSGEGDWLAGDASLEGWVRSEVVRSGAEKDVVRVSPSLVVSVVSVVSVTVSSIVDRDRAIGSSVTGVEGVAEGTRGNVGSLTDEFTFRIGGIVGVVYTGLSLRSSSAFLKISPMLITLTMNRMITVSAPYFR